MVFLGNPGSSYKMTRHNFGWRLLDSLEWVPSEGWRRRFQGRVVDLPLNWGKLLILRPGSYMNLCGRCVQGAKTYYRHLPEEIVVIHDELELPFGCWQLRRGGSDGGHNGIRSIVSSIGSRDFYRLRLGVGRPSAMRVDSFLLSRFSPEEESHMEGILSYGNRLLHSMLNTDPEELPKERVCGEVELTGRIDNG